MFGKLVLIVWVLMGALSTLRAEASTFGSVERVKRVKWLCEVPIARDDGEPLDPMEEAALSVKIERIHTLDHVSDRMILVSGGRGSVSGAGQKALAMIPRLERSFYPDRIVYRGSSRSTTAELAIARMSRVTGVPGSLSVSRLETRSGFRVPLNSQIDVVCNPSKAE